MQRGEAVVLAVVDHPLELERIRAGASLVQLYTAMVYEGPGIARTIATGLAQRLKREGMANISELVGTETA